MSKFKWFPKRAQQGFVQPEQPPEVEHPSLELPLPEQFSHSVTLEDPTHFGVEPVTEFGRDRVVSYLVGKDLKFTLDDEGDIIGIWDGNPFWFLFLGPGGAFFQLRGRWHRKVSHQNRTLAMQALNDWNREKLWPKAFIREDDDGLQNSVFGETTFDFSEGVTDKQLHYTIEYSLQCTLQLFEHLTSVVSLDSSEE